jgi:hypothetical protein
MPKGKKPHDDTRGFVESAKGRTDGLQHGPGMVPAMETRLPRTLGKRESSRAVPMSRESVMNAPKGSTVHGVIMPNGKLRVYMITSHRTPETREEEKPAERETIPSDAFRDWKRNKPTP